MAAENIGNLVPTKIPGYADSADIQAALRVYHYGSYDFDPNETDPAQLVSPSIAYTLNDMQDQIDGIIPGIAPSTFTAKGDLLSATDVSTPSILSTGTTGQVLTVNPATSTGLQWATPEVTLTNSVTLSGKTLTSPVINTPALTLSTTSSTTDARLSWDTTNKVLQIGNGSSVLVAPTFNINSTAKTGGYTFALTDQNTLIQMNGAYAFTVPLNSSVAFPVGAQIHLLALTSNVSVAFTSGVTYYATPGLKLRASGSMATLIKLATDTWVLVGDLIA